MTLKMPESAQEWEMQVEQKAVEYLQLLQPLVDELGFTVQMELCRYEPESSAYYKSTLDIRIVNGQGQVLWCDTLILYMNSVRWAELNDVLHFVQGALRQALHLWRTQFAK